MYTGNLIAELFYFLLLCGGIFAFICFMLVCTVKGIAMILGDQIVQTTNWLKKWADK